MLTMTNVHDNAVKLQQQTFILLFCFHLPSFLVRFRFTFWDWLCIPCKCLYYYYYYFYFYPRCLFPREVYGENKLKGYDAQSVQSGTGRLSCSRTALKRCSSTETRWHKWLVSLVSPEIEEILLPRSFRSRIAEALKTPKVSTAIGSNMWRPTMPAYFASLRMAANSAAAPASRAASVTYDSARGQDTVTSQHNDLPLCHGTSVRPSGLFPSDRNSPMGSLVTGLFI